MAHFDTYGRMAESDVDEVLQNGRYFAQEEALKRMPQDVIEKLTPQATDSFLDVGCGLGWNLEALVNITKDCSACDHPNVIKKMQQKEAFKDVAFYPGNFLDINFDRKFTRILSYCVLPSLPDEETLFAFVRKIVSLLTPDGKALLGDLSNADKKERFLGSERGKEFQIEWQQKWAEKDKDFDVSQFQEEGDEAAVFCNDDTILEMTRIIRKAGFHAYILDQKQDLAFGNTREDILIVGPEYDERSKA